MRRQFIAALIIIIHSCTPIYEIRNTTGDEKLVTIGMKVHKEANAEYYKTEIERSKNIAISNKSVQKTDSLYFMNYQIKIPSLKKVVLSDFIFTKVLRKGLDHDSIDIRLLSGHPIFVDSDSIRVNNFRLVFLPWFRRLYYYVIK